MITYIRYIKGSFNLPDIIDRFIQGKNQGLYHEPGLPNIEGMIEFMLNGSRYINASIPSGDNAFYRTKTGNTDWYIANVAENSNGHYQPRFDASRYNNIYGNSTTVQPKSIELYFYIKY